MTQDHHSITTQEFIRQLLSPERAQKSDPFVVLSFCPVNVHDTVADIGCGPGYFTLPLAKLLVNGKVYALDLDEQMVAACRERIAQARLGNVEVLGCDEFDFPLAQGSLDGVLLAFVVQRQRGQGPVFAGGQGAATSQGLVLGAGVVPERDGRRAGPGTPGCSRGAGEAGPGDGIPSQGMADLNGEHYMTTLRNG